MLIANAQPAADAPALTPAGDAKHRLIPSNASAAFKGPPEQLEWPYHGRDHHVYQVLFVSANMLGMWDLALR
jgi:hypothetical protein